MLNITSLEVQNIVEVLAEFWLTLIVSQNFNELLGKAKVVKSIKVFSTYLL